MRIIFAFMQNFRISHYTELSMIVIGNNAFLVKVDTFLVHVGDIFGQNILAGIRELPVALQQFFQISTRFCESLSKRNNISYEFKSPLKIFEYPPQKKAFLEGG